MATACLDVSDGVLKDLGRLARASGVGLQLDAIDDDMLGVYASNAVLLQGWIDAAGSAHEAMNAIAIEAPSLDRLDETARLVGSQA